MSVPASIRLCARWQRPTPTAPYHATAMTTVPCRPDLGPEERIFRFTELRLYAGRVSGTAAGVEAEFLLEFRFVRGTPLWSQAGKSSLRLILAAPHPPEGKRVSPDLRVSRCLGAILAGGGREMLAEIRLSLVAT